MEAASGAPFQDFERYNAAARSVMEAEGGVQINDLWSFSLPKLGAIQIPDNSHFTAAGSEVLAAQVAASIRAALFS